MDTGCDLKGEVVVATASGVLGVSRSAVCLPDSPRLPAVSAVAAQIVELFAGAGARVQLCVQEIGAADGGPVTIGADEPVATASVIKVVIAVAFARAVAAGTIDPTERCDVPARLRVGGTGTTGCVDPVQMSLRDLALSMMTVSDNAATDVVLDRVGAPAISAVVRDLGLDRTHLRASMEAGHLRAAAELGLDPTRDLDPQLEQADPDAVRRLAWTDPAHANASTPREIVRLLEAIWTDAAGPPDACAAVRSAMAQQVSTQRLASGFGIEGVRIAGKTGTLPAVRNEAGVVTYPDGRAFAAAVFTRADSLSPHRPDLDAAIGAAARMAVEHLRA